MRGVRVAGSRLFFWSGLLRWQSMPVMKILLILLLAALSTSAAERPNVILIISDDQAFGDYGFMGNEQVRTPNLDRMAGESLLFTRGYTMPVCSPSLASLLTGKLPHQHGITGNDLAKKPGEKRGPGNRGKLATQLLGNSLILPEALTGAGYFTFQTGKLWNVTFSEVGFTHGMTDTAGRHGDSGLKIGREGMDPVFDFIETATAEKKPFFIWHAPFLPHTPHNPPERLLEKYRGTGPTPADEKYHAMVEWFDETCGELDAYLTGKNLRENTVIIYVADNGWATSGDRAKLSPYENGIRTPVFIRWPGKIEPKRDEKSLVSIIDIPPTILELSGAENPGDLPGNDLLEPKTKRDRVFIEAYTHDIADLDAPEKSLIARVVIRDRWKLIVPGPKRPDRDFSGVPEKTVLYDLLIDPLETKDLAGENPDLVKDLWETLRAEWPALGGN